jgi:hypothetical protein
MYMLIPQFSQIYLTRAQLAAMRESAFSHEDKLAFLFNFS